MSSQRVGGTANFDFHFLRMIIYALGRPTSVKGFATRVAEARLRLGLHRIDAEFLAVAVALCVGYQQDQIRSGNLLYAERPEIHLGYLD